VEGAGWKLGIDRGSEEEFGAMVGGPGWSFALTLPEYDDFVKVLRCAVPAVHHSASPPHPLCCRRGPSA
jgi:Domain of unknown function (DUF1818)